MIVEILSNHFRHRWRRRVGGEPCLHEVNDLLARGTRLRNQRKLYRLIRGRYRPTKILAEYFHDGCGLLIRVDEDRKTAVTVIALRSPIALGAGSPADPLEEWNESSRNGSNGLRQVRSDEALGPGLPGLHVDEAAEALTGRRTG